MKEIKRSIMPMGKKPRHDGADWPYLVTSDEIASHRISRYRRSSMANAANLPKDQMIFDIASAIGFPSGPRVPNQRDT